MSVSKVDIKPNENLEGALKRFKKLNSEVYRECKKRAAYTKPSEKRKIKSKAARQRNNKKRQG
jgi:small subunit ribosomal protein S21